MFCLGGWEEGNRKSRLLFGEANQRKETSPKARGENQSSRPVRGKDQQTRTDRSGYELLNFIRM